MKLQVQEDAIAAGVELADHVGPGRREELLANLEPADRASQRIGQGRENAKLFLEQNPDVAAEIETAIRGKSTVPGVIAAADSSEESPDDDAEEGASTGRKGRG